MLKDSLYNITSLEESTDNHYTLTVKLDVHHEIFKGHFPAQPVLPGVCLIEMVKEFLMEIKKRPYRLSIAQNIKYLRLVDPNEEPVLKFELDLQEGEALKVDVTSFLKDGTANFKLKGSFV